MSVLYQKHNLSQLINQRFGHVTINRLILTARKGLMKGLPKKLPDLDESLTICILKRENKITRGTTIDILILPP